MRKLTLRWGTDEVVDNGIAVRILRFDHFVSVGAQGGWIDIHQVVGIERFVVNGRVGPLCKCVPVRAGVRVHVSNI